MTLAAQPLHDSRDLARLDASARQLLGGLSNRSEFGPLYQHLQNTFRFTKGEEEVHWERWIRDTSAQWVLQVEQNEHRTSLLHQLFISIIRGVVSYSLADHQQDVEGVASVAFCQFQSQWEGAGRNDSATALAACIAKRRAIDHLRSLARNSKLFLQVSDPEIYQPQTEWCRRLPDEDLEELLEMLNSCIDELKGVDRQLIELHYWEEQTSEEIGSLTGMAPPAVRQRVHRIRARLRECVSRKQAKGRF